MNIQNLDKLPDVASRASWARVLEVDQSTLWRAERKGHLKGTKTQSGTVIYTKAAILEWLGINELATANE